DDSRPLAFADTGRDGIFETSPWADVASFLLGEGSQRDVATVRVQEHGTDGAAAGFREKSWISGAGRRLEAGSPAEARVLRDQIVAGRPGRPGAQAAWEQVFATLLSLEREWEAMPKS